MMEQDEAGYHGVAVQANKQDSQAILMNSARMWTATGGSAGMNVNSGGPHILLFERDQQLTTLLTSEFQLAGYEFHPARTAVEVFDAIARFPIRLVLVDLAQAAASRREFWVALDAQRRGRGVQVFTFRCMNIAGYGADDSEDTSRTVLTDMEVDGMMGVMNLVDAVRSRIPGSTTGSFSRISAAPGANAQEAVNPNKTRRQIEEPSATQPITSQNTTPMSMMSSDPPLTVSPVQTPGPSGSVNPAGMNRPGKPAPGFTEKIRAVIYPSSRSFSPIPETNWVPHNPQNLASTQRVAGGPDVPVRTQGTQSFGANDLPLLNREAGPQSKQSSSIDSTYKRPGPDRQSPTGSVSPAAPSQEQESGLAQLSRMLHESNPSVGDKMVSLDSRTRPDSPLPQQEAHRARSIDSTALSGLSLRASPIQDIPIEPEQAYRAGHAGGQLPQSVYNDIASGVSDAASSPPVTPASSRSFPSSKERVSPKEADLEHVEENITTEAGVENIIARALAGLPRQIELQTLNQPSLAGATSDDTLLNIVQSLPPMPSLPTPPQPKTPVLSGRATRSLGSVLLEGHLVPQQRLEVAQQIQRMLRGVDMNYQLGEILLMFKLLTPDQLLAASLVSYGLISTAQISALGRIRQELYGIGLEYDLESLVVLFRILTSEQLREVRASWLG